MERESGYLQDYGELPLDTTYLRFASMTTIALISCSKKKATHSAPAFQLYSSPLFRLSLAYATQQADDIFILSALHGLVSKDTILNPYNTTLTDLTTEEQKEWAERVHTQLAKQFDLQTTTFLILAGAQYEKHLIPLLPHIIRPLRGLPLGKRLSFLKAASDRHSH